IVAEDFYGERRLESSESFVDGVFGGLRKVEDDARIRRQFLVECAAEFFLGVNGAAFPGRIFIRLQSNIKLAIEETGGVGAVIGAAKLRTNDCDLRILRENLADLGSEFGGFFERNGVRHGGAKPESAFIQV